LSRVYEKPTIVRVGNPLYAKHGAATGETYGRIRESIEGKSIAWLTENFGSPLFVFSERIIRERYRQAYAMMHDHYPAVRFGWSYKTNYLNGICQIFHKEGAWAEVVSEFEYDKAAQLGVPGEKIIFNGPVKSMEALRKAIDRGSIINVDHFQEIEDIERIARERQRKVRVGIRLNLDAGIYPVWSRFGFNLESGQARTAARRIAQSPHLGIAGVHCHIGTFILDPMAYGRAAAKMSQFIREVESLTGDPISYVDVGGGFPSLSHLKGIYHSPELAVSSFETFAQAIGEALKWLSTRDPAPTLFIESGRYLIDEAGYLVTSVMADKQLPDGRRAYVLDAGVNVLYTSTWYKFNVELDRETNGLMEPALLNGPLCMNIDVVDDAIMLPRLERYQRLILSPVGAYNVTQWMQFIQYRPAVVLVRESGAVEVLRRREVLDDINRVEAASP
jgi:diaminopimelate decarboxylase